MSILRDALKNLRSNADISIASIATVMSTLFVLGIFLLFILNVKMGIIGIYSRFEIRVTLKDDIKITDQENMYNKIKSAKGVTDITFENEKQALVNMKKKLDNRSKVLLTHFEKDIPPSAAYVIKVNGPEDIPKVISQINGLQGVNEINGGQNVPRKIWAITKIIEWAGFMLFFIFITLSFFLIKNTVKLAIYPRRNEISIMQYVGATDCFIRWPFIFEGMIIGFLGAVSAVIAIYLLYSFIYRQVAPYLETMFISAIDPSFISMAMSWSFMLIGMILCAVANVVVIRRFLVV